MARSFNLRLSVIERTAAPLLNQGGESLTSEVLPRSGKRPPWVHAFPFVGATEEKCAEGGVEVGIVGREHLEAGRIEWRGAERTDLWIQTHALSEFGEWIPEVVASVPEAVGYIR